MFCKNKDLVACLSLVIFFSIVKMGLRENFHSLPQISTINVILISVKLEHCNQNLSPSDLVSLKTHFNIIPLPTPGYPTVCRLFGFLD